RRSSDLDLRQAWDERRAEARWLRETLVLGLLAAKEAQRAGVPQGERLSALERIGPGRFLVHLGRLASAGDPGSLLATRRLGVSWAGGTEAPSTRWVAMRGPEAVSQALSEELRAISTAEAHLEGRWRNWRAEMQRTHRVSHHPFVRRQPSGRIELWLVPFTTDPAQIVLGGDYRLILDRTGRRVESFAPIHAGMTRIAPKAPAGGLGPKPEVRNHEHGGLEGDLPTASDLLKIATSPALRGLAVIGPRYALLVSIAPGGADWEGLLYFSDRFRELLDTGSR
ncbi:MAG: hypothetical protein RBU30_27880, partial [Polyangia bacterium]|nr:hypothetical protein [Polyangia bacterium]